MKDIHKMKSDKLALYWSKIAKEGSDIIRNGSTDLDEIRLNQIQKEIQEIRKELSSRKEKKHFV